MYHFVSKAIGLSPTEAAKTSGWDDISDKIPYLSIGMSSTTNPFDIPARKTAMAGPKRDQILDAAERMIRDRGFNGVSFRDLAHDVGIKSASVHYHFPTKADLGAAVARRYTERFVDALGDPEDADAIPTLIEAFRTSLARDQLMCLCGMLAAESGGLPDPVVSETRRFFERTEDWLSAALSASPALGDPTAASRLLAELEGAMLVARAHGDVSVFDRIVAPHIRQPETAHETSPERAGG